MKEIINFLEEAGHLKNIERSGWKTLKIKNPESVAEHSYRAAVFGYILAKKENVNPDKVATMLLFHDIPEARIGDIHKVSKKYLNKGDADLRSAEDQAETLPDDIGQDYLNKIREFEDMDTEEAVVAKDADLLECALQAKEYMDIGFKKASNWIDNTRGHLQTETGKKLLELIVESETEWWEGLKDI